MSADVAASTVKKEEHDAATETSSLNSGNRPPPYLPSTTSKPAELPRAYLNGTQDMLSLFGLMPIYDRAVRPYNPDVVKADTAATTSNNAAAATSSNAAPSSNTAGRSAAAAGAVQGATPSGSQQASGQAGNATPRPGNPPTGGAATTGLASHPSHASSSTGRISTPALQLNGGPPTFSLHTDSSAILAASPGQLAASAASAPPARKPSKPPPTYAHYVDDLAGRVRPPSKRMRAAKAEKGASLMSILLKPEYTPQRIVPFDRETMQTAFSVEPGPVAEIDQALLEPDEEETVKPKKKKKKIKQEGAAMASSGPPSAARTPVRR
ncbi:uncharacterized protein UTRI_00938_B [Ustilago trichophora]|uniref:Mediator of RNA polymerase II transcription subunit 19 n=1 Tax=Ustilago trichophora TaxID=86804 RepID=A0A5C3DW94_9BASI|nr:uncharacterized protein UTRI_00938_B [Ustilago trichophora]